MLKLSAVSFTIISAIIGALTAALIAAEIARRQLKAEREQVAEARRQTELDRAERLRVARASFPAVLSAICDYADAPAPALHSAWPTVARLYSNVGRHAPHRVCGVDALAQIVVEHGADTDIVRDLTEAGATIARAAAQAQP